MPAKPIAAASRHIPLPFDPHGVLAAEQAGGSAAAGSTLQNFSGTGVGIRSTALHISPVPHPAAVDMPPPAPAPAAITAPPLPAADPPAPARAILPPSAGVGTVMRAISAVLLAPPMPPVTKTAGGLINNVDPPLPEAAVVLLAVDGGVELRTSPLLHAAIRSAVTRTQRFRFSYIFPRTRIGFIPRAAFARFVLTERKLSWARYHRTDVCVDRFVESQRDWRPQSNRCRVQRSIID
jgi:hypothetical protein